MSDINFDNVTVDSSGRVRFGGLGSNLDTEAIVDATMAAKRVPVDRWEAEVETNKAKITALETLSSLSTAVQDSLRDLYGRITFGNDGDVFEAKAAFATTSRSDSGTASPAANLVGVSLSNAANIESHQIEILQLAKSHKVASTSASSVSDDLGTAFGKGAGTISGSFDVNGVTIDVASTDSLTDLRDRINAANTGASATGVTATIVSVSSTESVLVLTGDNTGETMTIDNEVGGVLGDLGISSDGGTTFDNELQVAQNAKLHVDGLRDPSSYVSTEVTSAADPLGTYGVSGSQSFDILDSGGATLGTVNYNATDDLTTLAANIDAIAGVTASVVTGDNGPYLQIDGDGGTAISFTNDTGSVISDLGIGKDLLVVERSDNTINDLFSGVTLDLYQAETGTTINVEVEQDLNQVKSAITSFVDAYNSLKQFLNLQEHNLTDADGNDPQLRGSRTVVDVSQSLSSILGAGATGISDTFKVLNEIGIDFVSSQDATDPSMANTLTIDEQKLDEALLNDPDQVEKLFTFNYSSSSPKLTLLNFTGNTTYESDGFTIDITHDGTNITSATIDGVAAEIDGNTIIGADGSAAEGLKLLYTGTGDLTGAQVDYTIGVGANLFFELDRIVDSSTGVIAKDIDGLEEQNTEKQDRIDEKLARIDYQRELLTARFVKMEQALSSMNSTLDQIKQITNSWDNSKN